VIAHELEVPDGMGLIVRTAGAARTKQELKRDFEYLLRLWENVRDMTLQSTAPCLVYEEGNLIKRSIRDLFTKDTDEILVAGEPAHKEAQDFMRMLSPSQAKSVIKFEDTEPLFARYNIERQLNAMFSPYVTLRSGGYLVINQTEALVSVDVNSGKSTREFSIEETALQTNLEASEELARQLKLRDLAGLIVIDFIDMEERRNNRKVENRLKDALRHDRARIQVGRISHFGLLEMSRQRLRTGVVEGSTSQCPHCQGTGIVRSTESVALAVLRAIEDHLVRDARSSLTAVTTAEVALYILNNKRSFVTDMERRHGVSITVEASARMQGANFAIEKSSAPIAPQKAVERPAAVNMAWGFEGQEGDEAPLEEAEAQTAEPEGDGRRPRRRRRRGRGRGADRGDQRDRGEDTRFAASGNGPADDSPPGDMHEDHEHGPDETYADGAEPEGIPGIGEQPSVPLRSEGDDRRGRPRRRGRRGGRRGRDREGPRHADDRVVAHQGNGSDIEPSEHAARADAPYASVAADEPPHVGDERAQTGRNDLPGEGGDRPWSSPAETHVSVAEPPVKRSADTVSPPRATEEPRHEPVHVEQPVEDDDPSRPTRKGWWQRRFTGST
jgi:ribonuclease E